MSQITHTIWSTPYISRGQHLYIPWVHVVHTISLSTPYMYSTPYHPQDMCSPHHTPTGYKMCPTGYNPQDGCCPQPPYAGNRHRESISICCPRDIPVISTGPPCYTVDNILYGVDNISISRGQHPFYMVWGTSRRQLLWVHPGISRGQHPCRPHHMVNVHTGYHPQYDITYAAGT